MAETLFKDYLPDLKELENKAGRKTPESLLIWMRDAAVREALWRSGVADGGDQSSTLSDSISAKISQLKQDVVNNISFIFASFQTCFTTKCPLFSDMFSQELEKSKAHCLILFLSGDRHCHLFFHHTPQLVSVSFTSIHFTHSY